MFKEKKIIPKYELVQPSSFDMEQWKFKIEDEWMVLRALRPFGNVKKGEYGGFVMQTSTAVFW